MLWDSKSNSGVLLPKSHGENLIPDPTFANWRENWAVKFSGPVRVQDVAVTSDTLSTFETVRTLRITTDQRCEVTLRKPLMVHATSPGEIYRFRLWLKIDPADAADCTFGVLGFDASGQAVQMLAQGGRRVEEADFTDIKLGYVSWLFINHYLMPASDAHHAWVEPRDTVGLTFQAPSNLAQLTPRFVLQARDGEVVTFQLALPSIDAVGLAPSDAARAPEPLPAPALAP